MVILLHDQFSLSVPVSLLKNKCKMGFFCSDLVLEKEHFKNIN